jgi:uncharacterized Zn finger protein
MQASGFLCPICNLDERQTVLDMAKDGQTLRLRCGNCAHTWIMDLSLTTIESQPIAVSR